MPGPQRMPVHELESLSPELDLFTCTPPPSRELLQLDLYPPLPVSPSHLIWGFHLLRAAGAAGKSELACRSLPPSPPAEMLRLALKLEARSGRYSWPEREACLAFLARYHQGNLLDRLAPLLEGKPDSRLQERTAAYSRLKPHLKELVAGGQLDLKSARRLTQLPDELFRRLAGAEESLTFSRRRLLLTRLEEIRRRDKLDEPALLSLLEEALSAADPPAVVLRRRHPVLTGLEDRFRALNRSALESSGIRLEAPPCFEGDAFTVSFSFRSRASLARKIARLKALEDQSDELFTLLR